MLGVALQGWACSAGAKANLTAGATCLETSKNIFVAVTFTFTATQLSMFVSSHMSIYRYHLSLQVRHPLLLGGWLLLIGSSLSDSACVQCWYSLRCLILFQLECLPGAKPNQAWLALNLITISGHFMLLTMYQTNFQHFKVIGNSSQVQHLQF